MKKYLLTGYITFVGFVITLTSAAQNGPYGKLCTPHPGVQTIVVPLTNEQRQAYLLAHNNQPTNGLRTTGCNDVIVDGGFEAGGAPSTTWGFQTSTNFSTPVCNFANCGNANGAAPPRTGSIWVWFGGIPNPETATIGQNFTIPAGGTATLNFWMRIGAVSSPYTDVVNVKVDGVIVKSYSEPSVAEAAYTLRSVDLSAYANGSGHTVLFQYIGQTNATADFVIDDVELIACSVSTDQFRSKQSGNWNDLDTWESSPDGTTWSKAPTIPNYNSGSITIIKSTVVTVTSNITTDQTTINSGGSLVVNPGIVLTMNDGTGTDLTVSSGGTLTLLSNSSGSGSIGNSAGTISGDITVERYISNKRAWRLLSVPFSSSAQTIKASWMEGAANISSNPNPGYGTQITTFTADANAANFDATKSSSSIRTYATNTFTSDAGHTPNTTSIVTANPAYFLFVRGDRAINRTTTGSATSATTLRITGTVNAGSVTKGVTGTNFSLIPNPYPSAIDFDAVKAANTFLSTFYVWDATLTGTYGLGQYRTIQITGSTAPYTYTATPGGASNLWRYIESGTAFFIPGGLQVNFTEAMKTSGAPPTSMLRTPLVNQTELVVNLNIVNADNTISLADGVREVFDNTYANAIDNNDAKKIAGFDINFGISSNNEILAVEKRQLPNATDVIFLNLSNIAQGNYQFELQPANLPSGLTPYLKDNYLGTYTPIDVTSDTKINFTITTDAASSSQNRFSIVFSKPNINLLQSILVYPNPIHNGMVTLQMNNMPKGTYSVRLLNALGQTVLSKQINHAEGSSTEIFSVNKIKGTYMLEVVRPDNAKQNNKIIIN